MRKCVAAKHGGLIDGAPSSVDWLAKELVWVNTSSEEFIFQTRKHPETTNQFHLNNTFDNTKKKTNLDRLLLWHGDDLILWHSIWGKVLQLAHQQELQYIRKLEQCEWLHFSLSPKESKLYPAQTCSKQNQIMTNQKCQLELVQKWLRLTKQRDLEKDKISTL